jgi:hypothetical protein
VPLPGVERQPTELGLAAGYAESFFELAGEAAARKAEGEAKKARKAAEAEAKKAKPKK